MKQKTLEDFIRDHRSEFDDLKAPPGIWKKIERREDRVQPMWKWTAVAATALLLVSLGFIFGTKFKGQPDIAGWKEYQETEQYYEARIQSRMEKIRTLSVSDEVTADLQVLDDVYQELKTQLMEDPNADAQVLLSAMIRHQQQKLEIMEKILNRVDKYKNNEKDSHKM